jgi:4-hydroxy-tetrahydrodipicolinate synthase
MKFEGIYTPVITPHSDDDSIDRDGFCAIKESSGDINRVHLLARDYLHIQMSCGMDDQAPEFFG